MIISRGSSAANREAVPAVARPAIAAPDRTSAQVVPITVDPYLVDYRLSALERLTRLYEAGTLSAEELAAEKALVLRLPAEELVLRQQQGQPAGGPSLLGRLLNWKLLSAGLVAGLCFSWLSEPRDLMSLVARIAGLAG